MFAKFLIMIRRLQSKLCSQAKGKIAKSHAQSFSTINETERIQANMKTQATPNPDASISNARPRSTSIPFIDTENLQGRIVISGTFHDRNQWKTWVSSADGQLLELKITNMTDGFYFASQPQSPSDANFEFMNFIAQHASFPELKKAILGIMDDISNLSASLSKLKLLHDSRNEIGTGIVKMAATEVEYILSVCRSLFDLLQEVIAKLWEMVTITDPSITKRSMKNKKSFADIAVSNEKPVEAHALVEKYGLPHALADLYASSAPFFIGLRKIRDNLIHNGSNLQTIFSSDTDFLISGHLRPFDDMKIWRDEENAPNNLVPLRPAINAVVYRTLAVCERFSVIMQQNFQLPPPLVPGMRIFMRGPFNDFFLDAMTDAMHRESILVATAPANQAPTEQ